MTKVIETISELRALRKSELLNNQSIGFVPTMGALHAGHQSLLRRCRQENAISVLSIFVNPAQFNNPDDLKHYPQTFETDLQIAQAEKVDYLFLPNADAMYGDGYRYKVTENRLSKELCGAHRPGHFDGVLTVVLKLLNLVQPHRVYFGEKDYQQYLLIKEMVTTFFLDIEVIPCPTIRDEAGLAFSSRNQRLSADEKKLAVQFASLLKSQLSVEAIKQQLAPLRITVDYIEEKEGRRFGAVSIGQIRLIDNVAVEK